MSGSVLRGQRRLVVALVLLLALLVSISGSLLMGYPLLRGLEEVTRSRHQSHLLADRLRHTSDDLTRMVRTYAATGDRFYKDQFSQVLAIRNGTKPRPMRYHQIYWDLILTPADAANRKEPGEKMPLRRLMIEAGMETRELALLDLAETRSNALVRLEVEAMHAMEGRFRDAQGRYTVQRAPDPALALRLLHGRKYHQAKKAIMEPIDKFMTMLDGRTRRQLDKQLARVHWLILGLALQLLAAVIIVVFIAHTSRAQHRAHLAALTDEVEEKTRELATANQDLARSNKELEQFASVASHDLQEPLRMVTSYLQLIERRLEGELDQKTRTYLEFAVDGAARMKGLIDALLRFSRVGSAGTSFATFPCGRALDAAMNMLKVAAEENRVVVETGPMPEVHGDEAQVTQVFQNLVGNAIKFNGQGPSHVQVNATEDGASWLFSVKDDGIGIEADHQEKIFQIFQRLHTRKEYDGTGIGLALCQRIVERHGGEIWVESSPGQGATFYFTLPRA